MSPAPDLGVFGYVNIFDLDLEPEPSEQLSGDYRFYQNARPRSARTGIGVC